MKALDKGPFILYLCIDILIDQSVNPQVQAADDPVILRKM